MNSPSEPDRCRLSFLGHQATSTGLLRVQVFRLDYFASDEVQLTAKLYVPEAVPPEGGWPVSLFCHGFGDPATDYYRWPLVGHDWTRARGELAGSWAQQGIVTLTPWLPGAGPSQPLGGYSPLSLARNAAAVRAGFRALQAVEPQLVHHLEAARPNYGPLFNHRQQILRTDCVATPLGVEVLRTGREHPELSGLQVWVADDLPPSPAYHIAFMTPAYDRLAPPHAASCYLLWARCTWALAQAEGRPIDDFLTANAQRALLDPVPTPIGPLPALGGLPIFSQRPGSLVARTLQAVQADQGTIRDSRSIRDWLTSPHANALLELRNVADAVQHPVYRRYLAASDPFFAENVTPFAPGIPLVAVGGRGDSTQPFPGLPTFDERFEQMTRPKLDLLRNWGWEVRLARFSGQSFADTAARAWALEQVRSILSEC